MEAIIKEFVEKELSNNSSFYIMNELFQNAKRIEAEMLSLVDYDKKDIFIVSDLDQAQFELYIIMDSLSRRMRGTRRRINEMCTDNDDDLDLFNQRNRRLGELKLDWRKTRRYLYTLLEMKNNEEIERVKSENQSLLKEEFYFTEYIARSGYIYVFFKEKKFGMTNQYAMGGD